MADVKRVYTFGNKEAEGNGKMRELLGGKGANLAEMNLIGIPVPPGFTITTEVCSEYYAHGKDAVIQMLRPEVEKAMKNIEKLTGMKFGDKEMPLLVSVRSGARASMPGMMDTVLNLGLNDDSVLGLIAQTQNPRFAWDSYRRFIQMYSDVVMEVGKKYFEELIDQMNAAGWRADVVNAYQTAGGAPYLDYTDTVFGQVYEGMEVVDTIAQTGVDETQRPTEAVTINSVTITKYE